MNRPSKAKEVMVKHGGVIAYTTELSKWKRYCEKLEQYIDHLDEASILSPLKSGDEYVDDRGRICMVTSLDNRGGHYYMREGGQYYSSVNSITNGARHG